MWFWKIEALVTSKEPLFSSWFITMSFCSLLQREEKDLENLVSRLRDTTILILCRIVQRRRVSKKKKKQTHTPVLIGPKNVIFVFYKTSSFTEILCCHCSLFSSWLEESIAFSRPKNSYSKRELQGRVV